MSMMCAVLANQPDHPVAVEGRRHDGQVMQVAGAEPGVVGDEVVARPHHLGRELGQEVPHRLGHRIHMAGRAGHCLRHHPPLEVEDARAEVSRLAHRRAEGGADHGLRLLLHHGDQPVPLDLALDGGEGVLLRFVHAGHFNTRPG
jgi:hypothetical protein